MYYAAQIARQANIVLKTVVKWKIKSVYNIVILALLKHYLHCIVIRSIER